MQAGERRINIYLVLGATCSAIAALAHLGCIIFGADWYRFFGAGEQMAQMAEQGLWYPSVVTAIIVVILAIWSLYGLSGAKAIIKLPLLKFALVVISLIYLTRGVAFVAIMPMFPGNSLSFWLVSSGICFIIGTFYAIGTYQNWQYLSGKTA
ncbi:hypothetical protein [Shewanella waksmanii]|uniref:hypothetical protein n=1 Tax=Shewanella waksmanii TaxID=213783 RepID=UPI00048D6798|nr:hypothetical protein [Shewanella waksmanii]